MELQCDYYQNLDVDKDEIYKQENIKYIQLQNKKVKSNKLKLFNCNPKKPNINQKDFFLISANKIVSFIGSQMYLPSDPLTGTALQLLDNINIPYKETVLYKFYQSFQPKNYADVFNVNINKFKLLSPHAYFCPWKHDIIIPPYDVKYSRLGLFGPKKISHVKHRVIRLKQLIKSISQNGYQPNKFQDSSQGTITGYILLKNNDYRFVIVKGHHRSAVLLAIMIKNNTLHSEKIIVKIDAGKTRFQRKNEKVIPFIVTNNNLNKCPGIKELSENEINELFNSYFR